MCDINKEQHPSPMMTETGKKELYQYSVNKMTAKYDGDKKVPLTGLNGIVPFFYYANEAMRANSCLKYAAIRMDIYHFKTVNEFCGRSAGDGLLKYIGKCFAEYENDQTVVGHLRADIFAMCIPFNEEQELIDIATAIKKKIDEYPLACKAFPAIGICIRRDDMDISVMCDYADLALQKIKGKAFKYYEIYTNSIREKILFEKKIENEISDALCDGEIKMYLQPKVDMRTGNLIGAEALVRWERPKKGFLSPDKFIPVLEKSGHVIEVDHFIWEKAFAMQAELLRTGAAVVPVSVNVSLVDVYQDDFTDVFCRLSDQYKVSPEYVQLEVTERVFVVDQSALVEKITYLQGKGFRFLMDDFGSGYSSLNMLKNEPVDQVKLDREFLSDIEAKKSKIVIRNLIQMISELGIDMIAEGVENEMQEQFLLTCGCFHAQGFKYYRPMPQEEYEKLVILAK